MRHVQVRLLREQLPVDDDVAVLAARADDLRVGGVAGEDEAGGEHGGSDKRIVHQRFPLATSLIRNGERHVQNKPRVYSTLF